MIKNLVIVESPAKAKTIEKFLGKDFVVKSSIGHIRDLVKKGLGVDTANNFEPTYEISEDKKDVVKELKKLAKEADTVWLATDEDREGEAISWHLAEALGLDVKKTKRVVYHEITKEAIQHAIDNPRKIDLNLVDAQQARRVLDRLVGFELSPVLWKKIKPSLSAGRVQSVAVRIIVDREREINAFKSETFFRVQAHFDLKGKGILKAELPQKLESEKEAMDFLKECVGSDFKIASLETKPAKRSPAAPFTTSTLQQEASRKLGYSVAQTMSIAQRLYEEGLITYMRTDSVNLSETAITAAEKEITSSYGKEYVEVRRFKTKAKGAQEAHEAIRPTYFEKHEIEGEPQHEKLYNLIWRRTIASQMSDAELEKTNVVIDVSKSKKTLAAHAEVMKFDGFLKVYMESTDDENEEGETNSVLPGLDPGQNLILTDMMAKQRFSHHPARYTEASLVKKLEEKGIGRPSTYAPTISTVQKRGYIIKETREGEERPYKIMTLENGLINSFDQTEITGAEKNKLFPTDIGTVVNDFLEKHFSSIVDYNFTATVEKEFDEIASGDIKWKKMIDAFYQPFHKNVEDTTENSERANGERQLGVDPKSGKIIFVRIGRFGPMAQMGETPKEGEEGEKPRFAKLRPNQRLESITFEEALDLFKMPKDLGEYEGKKLTIGIGRFGPYVLHDSKFISIPKGEDPMELELPRAIELVEAKRQADKDKFIAKYEHEGADIEVLNGRFGPYIKKGKENFKIPKGTEAKALTLADCVAIMETAAKEPKKKFFKKKK
ncbi:MAG: type I DNA topoisomerase [Bacteroidetes bacterium]|nr:type I DNA topoisomerase [Bacteroidota bacterium]